MLTTPKEAAQAHPLYNANNDRYHEKSTIAELQAGVKADDASAQYYLGLHFLGGTGGVSNPEEGLRLITVAAEQEYAPAMDTLGVIYTTGDTVTKDTALGLKWLRMADELDYAPAIGNLGMIHIHSGNTMQGILYLGRAAALGDAAAMGNLGAAYINGYTTTDINVITQKKTDLHNQYIPEGIQLLEKAEKLGDELATRNLASMYFHGAYVPQDREKALRLYEKAAAAGDKPSKEFLKTFYDEGGISIQPEAPKPAPLPQPDTEQKSESAPETPAITTTQERPAPQNNTTQPTTTSREAPVAPVKKSYDIQNTAGRNLHNAFYNILSEALQSPPIATHIPAPHTLTRKSQIDALFSAAKELGKTQQPPKNAAVVLNSVHIALNQYSSMSLLHYYAQNLPQTRFSLFGEDTREHFKKLFTEARAEKIVAAVLPEQPQATQADSKGKAPDTAQFSNNALKRSSPQPRTKAEAPKSPLALTKTAQAPYTGR